MATRLMSFKIKTMRHLILALILLSVLFVAAVGQQQVHAWKLTVKLEQGSFGSEKAIVTVRGPFGWDDRRTVPTGPDTRASFDIPASEIPDGYEYKVCVSSGHNTLFIFQDSNCDMHKHTTGDKPARIEAVIP